MSHSSGSIGIVASGRCEMYMSRLCKEVMALAAMHICTGQCFSAYRKWTELAQIDCKLPPPLWESAPVSQIPGSLDVKACNANQADLTANICTTWGLCLCVCVGVFMGHICLYLSGPTVSHGPETTNLGEDIYDSYVVTSAGYLIPTTVTFNNHKKLV